MSLTPFTTPMLAVEICTLCLLYYFNSDIFQLLGTFILNVHTRIID